LGGEKEGLLRVLYQLEIADSVKGVAKIPTSSQPITETANLKNLLTYSIYTKYTEYTLLHLCKLTTFVGKQLFTENV